MLKQTVSRPGYFRAGSDRVQIPVNALKVGMRVLELDRPWTETPFLLPRVLLVRDQNHEVCEERILDLGKLSGQEGQDGWLIRTVVPNGVHGIRIEDYVRRGLQIQ